MTQTTFYGFIPKTTKKKKKQKRTKRNEKKRNMLEKNKTDEKLQFSTIKILIRTH